MQLLALENSAEATTFQRIRIHHFVRVRQLNRQGHRIAFDRTRVERRAAFKFMANSNRTGTFAAVSSVPGEATLAVER